MTEKPIVHAVGGFAAGIVGTLLGYPLDVLKTAMQTKQSLSMRQSIWEIYSHGGIVRFYRGVTSPLVSLAILNTVNFSSYNAFLEAFKGLGYDMRIWRVDCGYTLAAMAVGPIASMISTPFELVKLQLQLEKRTTQSNPKYNGSLHAARSIFKKHGVSAFYTGHSVNTLREMIFLGTYFSTYEFIKPSISSFGTEFSGLLRVLAVPMAGGVAGALAWIVSFPLDSLKSIIQGQNLETLDLKSWPVFKDLVKRKGFIGLYSGVLPSIARAFLVSSSRFTVYEITVDFFK